MPKRVIDFDALWASDKLASCAEWAQSEYAWLYGLADASGSFEMTNLRVIWGRVAAIRKNLTLERLAGIFDEFIARGLLFTWEENGKRYGHWTGSDVPGRLPAPSWRMRLEKLAPPVPRQALAAYSARFGGSREAVALGANAGVTARAVAAAATDGAPRTSTEAAADSQARGLKAEVEETQAQDWDLDLNLDLVKEVSAPRHVQERRILGAPLTSPQRTQERGVSGIRDEPHPSRPISDAADQLRYERPPAEAEPPVSAHAIAASDEAALDPALDRAPQAPACETAPEELLDVYEAERGALPPARILTAERRGKCAQWLAAGFTADDFRAAVQRAAATPFLTGAGERGWRASFDWLIADPGNARKVLEGEYASSQPFSHARSQRSATKSRPEKHALADLYAGTGPRPADCGVRVNPAALERIRAREARLALGGRGAHAAVAASESPCRASTPQAAAGEAPNCSPQRVACMAQPRASPAILKS